MKTISGQINFPFVSKTIAEENSESSNHDYGTFKDCRSSPIHRWFEYPAGYSYRLVWQMANRYRLNENSDVYDPFAGCGTTLVAAKQIGVNSIGVEAHPFVYWVAKTKIHWEFNLARLREKAYWFLELLKESKKIAISESTLKELFPELVLKCYSKENLSLLYHIRELIKTEIMNPHYRDLFNLALTRTLRKAASVHTGWPYIAPNKARLDKSTNVVGIYSNVLLQMVSDLSVVRTGVKNRSKTKLYNNDSRNVQRLVKSKSIDLAITSPPYLNNYDYADRTRLETYFFGIYKNWGEITEKVRDKLIISATTQVIQRNSNGSPELSTELRLAAPSLSEELHSKINEVSDIRLTRGGKKAYDYMISGYFSDMFKVLKETHRVLKDRGIFVLVVGDSAPYGVHIPTEEYLGEIGLAIGFSEYKTQCLRLRGGKWKNNPQRHKVGLKEVILTLWK